MSKILVVDDIEDNIKLLSFDLEDDDHQVITATNGKECLLLAETEKPDLILLDMMMPIMDGKETLTHLKQDDALKEIPVIMVSAKDGDDDVIEALDIGAHDYVAKPFIYPVLAARMRSALRLKASQEKLMEANQLLEKLASYDSLTGAYNRRQFFNLAKAEFSKTVRSQQPLSIIMLDIDHFKSINDTYGHAAGDQALIDLTKTCKEICRTSDIISRFGGEEFVICCPSADLHGAASLAERLREGIAAMTLKAEAGKTFKFTASFGVSSRQPDDTLESQINRADKWLYKAKEGGRNKVVSDANNH
ncbi:MAG: diguanylate cyclase [Candidatus Pelagadaptatus aseana]|uniref:diguanylate cyclase n=1 Tax=Candidatus Pelagadaptatus aseana TaxID=3120508 RepID=UPI0039B2D445